MRIVAMLMLAWCLLGSAPRAHAKTFVVDQAGGGDFTTIQAAVDSANARFREKDTVLVHPGVYPERLDLDLSIQIHADVLIATGGPPTTSILTVTRGGYGGDSWTVSGFTVQEPGSFTAGSNVYWQHCVFLGNFYQDHDAMSSNLIDCDFYAPVTLINCTGALTGLRFHHAPLTVSTTDSYGGISIEDCVFEGAGFGTLVTAGMSGDMWVRRCQFSNADVGLRRAHARYDLSITHCSFRNLVVGVFASDGATSDAVIVDSSRFENCSRAGVYAVVKEARITNSTFFANEGAGVDLTLVSAASVDSVYGNTFAFNLGDGLSVGGGIAGLPPGLAIVRNIAVQNGGAGIRLRSNFGGTLANTDSWQNYGSNYVGSALYQFNNFSADPMFCDLVNGDLTLSVGSPCRPIGSRTVPIGAYGVGCDQELLAAPPSAPALAFAVRPSPARGSVEFALPAGATGARVEVLDAQGRRVWSADVAPGARAVRWQGEAERGGSAGAGVYWARLTGAGEIQSKRFVWLR